MWKWEEIEAPDSPVNYYRCVSFILLYPAIYLVVGYRATASILEELSFSRTNADRSSSRARFSELSMTIEIAAPAPRRGESFIIQRNNESPQSPVQYNRSRVKLHRMPTDLGPSTTACVAIKSRGAECASRYSGVPSLSHARSSAFYPR